MRKIAVIHFHPLEIYPPAQNFIRFLESQPLNNTAFLVLTTATSVNNLQPFKTGSANIKIRRLAKSSKNHAAFLRYCNYFLFYFSCLWYLIRQRPAKILYYETLSFFPVYLYKKFLNPGVALFIHYHEYTSAAEYKTNMLLANYFNKLEKQYYPKAQWLSQTNNYRMKMFLAENLMVPLPITHALPNHPPKAWAQPVKSVIKKPVKLVYAGAIDLESMYLKEFAAWIDDQKGEAVLDIYSLSVAHEAISFLENHKSKYINLLPGISYEQLAGVLPKYDVGVALYKGVIANHIYSASNKMFEYLACGLDVWFPKEMIGSLEYVTIGTFPKVIALDFKNLRNVDINVLISREGLRLSNTAYYAEDVLLSLFKALT
jgi:hypothetical protein